VTLDEIAPALARLPAVDLASLDAIARLQIRRDRKYLVSPADVVRLVDLVPPPTRVLAIDELRVFRYESLYFDTEDLASYLAATRGRPERWKVRLRWYLDANRCVLEIKRRNRRGFTVKSRADHSPYPGDQLDRKERDFVGACPAIREQAWRLRPVLRTAYRRATLLLPEGDRVTVDLDLCSTATNSDSVCLVGMAVVETKSWRRASTADHLLRSLGHRPVRMSKYATSLAALRTELPSNRWTRALRAPWTRSVPAATMVPVECPWPDRDTPGS
jgi:hypothetical protein